MPQNVKSPLFWSLPTISSDLQDLYKSPLLKKLFINVHDSKFEELIGILIRIYVNRREWIKEGKCCFSGENLLSRYFRTDLRMNFNEEAFNTFQTSNSEFVQVSVSKNNSETSVERENYLSNDEKHQKSSHSAPEEVPICFPVGCIVFSTDLNHLNVRFFFRETFKRFSQYRSTLLSHLLLVLKNF